MGFFNRHVFTLDKDNEVLEYGSERILRYRLTELFLAEHALRELTQREDWLHHKVAALEKAITLGTSMNTMKFEDAKIALENLNCNIQERNPYDRLRRDPKWYMREEMVQDCSDRGGCCSRECGCCEQRHLSKKKKGRGHCTVECRCCIGLRGFELPESQKQEMRQNLESMLKEVHSPYALRLANCFFLPVEIEAPGVLVAANS
ncbi:unnamed protein product [Penicillium nalgiovense]|nr:unnamed protein product [Penicillium nalgiovense]